jgi:hypothetical protein
MATEQATTAQSPRVGNVESKIVGVFLSEVLNVPSAKRAGQSYQVVATENVHPDLLEVMGCRNFEDSFMA